MSRSNPWVENRPERRIAPLNVDIVESHMRLRQLQRIKVIVARNDVPTMRSFERPNAGVRFHLYHLAREWREWRGIRGFVTLFVFGIALAYATDTLTKGPVCGPALAGCPSR